MEDISHLFIYGDIPFSIGSCTPQFVATISCSWKIKTDDWPKRWGGNFDLFYLVPPNMWYSFWSHFWSGCIKSANRKWSDLTLKISNFLSTKRSPIWYFLESFSSLPTKKDRTKYPRILSICSSKVSLQLPKCDKRHGDDAWNGRNDAWNGRNDAWNARNDAWHATLTCFCSQFTLCGFQSIEHIHIYDGQPKKDLVKFNKHAILGSEVVLSPVVSGCLRLSAFMWGVGVGWCGRLLGLWSGLVSRCLPLSPVVSLHVGGGCWLVWSASWALKWSCLPLSPVVSCCLPSCGGWVLVGVVGFLGSEVVLSPVVPLSPIVSGCLPSCGGWCWLVWSASWALKWSCLPLSRCLPLSPVVCLHVGGGCWLVWSASWALKWSCLPLSPVVSHCLRLSPFMWGLGVGWCGRLLGLWSGLVSRCLPLSPVGGCWLLWSASWALKWSCLPLSPVVSLHVGGGCWLVWPPSWALKCFFFRCLRLSPFMWGVGVGWCGRLLGLWSGLVSRCLLLSPFMWGAGLVGVAASRTETFRDQNHRLQSKFAFCKLFGVYAGVIFASIS